MYKGDKTKFTDADLAEMEKRRSRTYIKTPDEENDKLPQGNSIEGWKLYSIYCKNCHQGNGKGDNNRFPPLAGSEYVTGDKDRLIKILLNGLQGEINVAGKKYDGLMPPFGHLDDHAIASILTIIRSRYKNNASAVTSDEVKKVREANKR
jgi:mono/diheme cytochrome c family protein